MDASHKVLPSEKYRNQHSLGAASKVHISKRAMIYSDSSTSSPYYNRYFHHLKLSENEESQRRMESHDIWHKLKSNHCQKPRCSDDLRWMGTGMLGRFYRGPVQTSFSTHQDGDLTTTETTATTGCRHSNESPTGKVQMVRCCLH